MVCRVFILVACIFNAPGVCADDRIPEDSSHQQEHLKQLIANLPDELKQHAVREDIPQNEITGDRLTASRKYVRKLLLSYDRLHRISRSAPWRQISGWREYELLGLSIPGLELPAKNQNPEAYADAQGLTSAAEDFASFGSRYFLPDQTSAAASIMCRTPTKYQFFRALFPNYRAPLDRAGYHCIHPAEGFLDDIRFFDPLTLEPLAIGRVDAESVEGFELLYATPGVGDAAEIAGHLVLRIRLRNNPEADAAGIENPNDIVVSFLADTQADKTQTPLAPQRDDATPPAECRDGWFEGMLGGPRSDAEDAWSGIWQALKGLSGGFLTVFDRQTMAQTIRMYTGFQDRNLLRYRLVLTEAQKSALINRLYLAKLNYKAKYYFFDRNCASILVQVIGEGIGESEVANFDPFVIPPNSLIALLRRKGLAVPVYPAFYSYKRRAHVAQEIMLDLLTKLRQSQSKALNIADSDFFHPKEATRIKAYSALSQIVGKSTTNHRHIYQLATLGQESEQDFLDREKLCDNYTSEPTRIAREIQRAIISVDQHATQKYALSTNEILHQKHLPHERYVATTGSPHTKLMSFGVGIGLSQYQERTAFHTSFRGSLFKQEMGSRSSQAMQRATAVQLGSLDMDVENKDGRLQTRRLAITALKVQKFKERLEAVPAYAGPQGSLGLGLTVLRGEQIDDSLSHLIWGGGELLANITSSPLFQRYLYLHIGLDAESRWGTQTAHLGPKDLLVLPTGLNALYTFDQARKWQLRVYAERRWHLLPGLPYTNLASIRLSTMFGRPWGAEAVAGLEYLRRSSYNPDQIGETKAQTLSTFLELNRW